MTNKTTTALTWSLLMASLLFAGCATTTGNIRMIGTEADFISKAGFTDKAQVSWLSSNVYRQDRKAEFSPDTPEVVWFMVFQNAAFLFSADFIARWYSPDGAVFYERHFGLVPGNPNCALTSLPIRDTSAADKPGKWTLEIEYKTNIIARRSFELLKSH